MTQLSPERLDALAGGPSEFVHVITIATKPDIIKQAPVFHELRRRGEQVLLCHTGHHYDDTRRYVDQLRTLSAEDRHKIFEGNARKVFPRLGNRSARQVNASGRKH